MPRLTSSATRNLQYVSDIFIEDADFLKLSNITVGYDINKLITNTHIAEARIYCTAKNMLVLTKYSGMDPEVGYAPESWGSGVDLGLYPAAKTLIFGVSIRY